jgi:hypothetical protein
VDAIVANTRINNNVDNASALVSLLLVDSSNDFVIRKVQCNSNNFSATVNFFRAIQLSNSNNVITEKCVVLDNTSSKGFAVAIHAFSSRNLTLFNFIVKDCFIARNTKDATNIDSLNGIAISGGANNAFITGCVVSNLNSNTSQGILLGGANNILIEDCHIADLFGANGSLGIASGGTTANVTIRESTIKHIDAAGSTAVGISVANTNAINIKDCDVFDVNSSATTTTAAAVGIQVGTNSTNAIIEDCNIVNVNGPNVRGITLLSGANHNVLRNNISDLAGTVTSRAITLQDTSANVVDNNISGLSGDVPLGIFINRANAANIINNNVSNVLGNTRSKGLTIQNSNDVNVLKNNISEVFATTVSAPPTSNAVGFEIISGTNIVWTENISNNNVVGFLFNDNVLLKDNTAVGNTLLGFVDLTMTPPATSYALVGNVAYQNGTNYDGTLIPLISLQTLAAGTFTNVHGNAALGARFTNISIV